MTAADPTETKAFLAASMLVIISQIGKAKAARKATKNMA
jgi:hypothetical protein